MISKEQQIADTIECLKGTCNSLSHCAEINDLDDMDEELVSAIDQEIFCCTSCNWWCEISEEVSAFVGHPEMLCRDCAVDEYDYED